LQVQVSGESPKSISVSEEAAIVEKIQIDQYRSKDETEQFPGYCPGSECWHRFQWGESLGVPRNLALAYRKCHKEGGGVQHLRRYPSCNPWTCTRPSMPFLRSSWPHRCGRDCQCSSRFCSWLRCRFFLRNHAGSTVQDWIDQDAGAKRTLLICPFEFDEWHAGGRREVTRA